MSDDTDPGRLHTSVLVGPEGELRRHRKARAQAAARIHAEARAETVAKLRAEAAAAREARYEAERLEAGREDDPTGA